MIRLVGAACAALALAGCVAGDRVTLLPSATGDATGAIAVLDPDGAETVLDQVNTQARLSNRRPSVRTLNSVDPAYGELINSLPAAPEARSVRFGTASSRLTDEQVAGLQSLLSTLADRPGWQVEIAAYTDSVGSEDDNLALSRRRAAAVAEQLTEAGFQIDASDIVGRGEFAAKAALGDEVASAEYRRVDITIR